MAARRDANKLAYGDFQTPLHLAQQVCARLLALGLNPRSIVEPTCGLGTFVVAALQSFTNVENLAAMDINPAYVQATRQAVHDGIGERDHVHLDITVGDFFLTDWEQRLASWPDPILFIGNPPWVTNAGLSILGHANIPPKGNFRQLGGLEAVTGASNFDISEAMLLRLMTLLQHRRTGFIAMLCKQHVARKVLLHHWQTSEVAATCSLFKIDTPKLFGVAVEASLLLFDATQPAANRICAVYDRVDSPRPVGQIGFHAGKLVSDIHLHNVWRHLARPNDSAPRYQWRSGIKHDAASVMELIATAQGYQNKLGETWRLEEEHLFPMLKSSDIVSERVVAPRFMMLVPQFHVGQETSSIRHTAPATWDYLNHYGAILDGRKSRIYRGRPRFAIFGVGEYTFAPWKVAIAGMYKKLRFKVVGPVAGRPVVFDDTCYFLACASEAEARFLADLFNSPAARAYYTALVFWQDKRPITARLLRALDIGRLAEALGVGPQLDAFQQSDEWEAEPVQLRLLEGGELYETTPERYDLA